jgi:UDP-N-acetylglucosamine diphosphorylase / glucose-1-phosphate thymidylyltransferase / UDP-N-acetylgalactosamine diphosphorylase / glucosamine-1-phosphate N-acetyltransferase / galactosamine-1-phosphate N-acetyltransferase
MATSINIVIPMAGAGSRFVNAGYKKPKPFIDVNGKPMVARVIENLYYPDAHYYLIASEEHMKQEADLVKEIETKYNATFIPINILTEGAACTVLYTRKYINNNKPLVIANSDQIIDMEIADFINDCLQRQLDGSILTFVDKYLDPKWSFAKINENKLVTQVKEKEAISEYATVGIYMFSPGSLYVNAAIDMIINNDRVNNEFYVCPVYNYAIKEQKKIGIYNIAFEAMHGLGTPDDLNLYLKKITS